MNSNNAELAPIKLMELFNHSSVAITKRYLGLRKEEILETYLIGTTQNIQEIAFTFGFSSQVQFNKFFKKMKGCAPGQYRKKAKSVVV